MKKVIIAILLLIPILVILTISASGLLIASAFVDIPAESIVLKHSGEEVKSEEIILEEQNPLKKYMLFCEVFPGIATDEMIWASSDENIVEVIPSDSRKDAAEITFKDYGSVDVTCTSKKNTSISARVTFYVTGKLPGYIVFGDYSGETFESLTMRRYDVTSVLASVKPAISVRGAKVQWSSSDTSVVKVDNNGVLTALKEGNATITATVTTTKTVSKELPVIVTGTSVLTQKTVYSAEDSFDVSPYLTAAATVEGGTLRDLSRLGYFETEEVTVHFGDDTEMLTVVRVPSDKSVVIENLHELKKGALSSFISLGSSNVELRAIALDGSTSPVTWHSTDTAVIRVENGRLYAAGSGSAEVFAALSGYESERVTVRVTSTVDDFILSERDYLDKVGLLQERVFGNYTYQDGQYTREYALTVRSFPEGASIESYTFESANREVATVNDSGVVTFAEDVQDKSVTIIATAYNQEGLPVRRSYTFRMVNGVNVGVGVGKAHFDASKGETPSFEPYFDLKTVASAERTKGIVLHTDIYYPKKSDGGTSIMNLTVPIYGNGNKLDGQFFVESVEDDEMLLLWDFDTFDKMPSHVDVSLVNLSLQATHPTTEDSKETFEELNRTGGGAISLKGNYIHEGSTMRLTVKGCLLQYAYSHINVAIGEVLLDGCILRNNSASAIVLQESSYCKADLKIKNCIFSHTIAPVAIACGNFDEILARDKGSSTGEVQFGSFELEGNIYVYNWKKLEEVQMSILPQNLKDKRANALVRGANDFLGKVIQEAFKKSDVENLYVDKDGVEWLNFSFLMIGLWENMNPYFNDATLHGDGLNVRYDPLHFSYAEVRADKAPSVSGLMALFSSIVDLQNNKTYHIGCKNESGEWNTLPGENYEIDDVTRARLRGEHA